MIALWISVRAFFSGLWRFLGTPFGQRLMVVLIILAVFACGELHGFSRGVQSEKDAEDKRNIAAMDAAMKLSAAASKITAKTRADLEAANKRNADLTLELQKKVTTYVTPQADRACRIPVGYVLMRNAAGAGVDPLPPGSGGSVDADSGLVLSDLVKNDITNAAAFHAATNEIKAWRDWYVSQADIWNAKTTSVDTARP